ncbi:uncharacterized protein [Eucyclogobius newberryi]|uniref:uncharacterized protein n=1 Tax=Eucyclogobius newberryi TaxID=166745 RepID=UPI003B5B910B
MPSVFGQNLFTMEKQKVVGETCTFICTICGDGFSQYQNVLCHMSIHGPLESFTFDGSSNGFEVPREYVLQENGTLTALTGLTHNTQYSTKRPCSPGILPSHFSCPANSVSPLQKSFSRDVLASKALDSNLDNFHGDLYHCEVCSRTFNSLQFLHRHQQYRNIEGGYRCTLCCRFFKGSLEFKKHIQNHTHERFHCCALCGKRFVKKGALNVHMNQKHSSTVQFNEFENSQDFKLERSYSCKKCKLTFFWLSDFQVHSFFLCKGREVSAKLETEVASRVDLKSCNGTSSMHGRNGAKKCIDTSSETDSTYRCGLCGERFPELTALKEHHTTHEFQQKRENLTLKPKSVKRLIKGSRKIRKKMLRVKIYQCKLCRCVFRHSSSLIQHMRYHKGTIYISKQIYNQALGSDNKNNSQEEQRVAHENYKCLKCGKKFGLLCVYKTHLNYHKKESKTAAESTNSSSKDEKPGQDMAEESSMHEAAPSEEHVLEVNHAEDLQRTEENGVLSAPNDKENVPEPVYTCTECSQTFACMETYVQHQVSHGSEN